MVAWCIIIYIIASIGDPVTVTVFASPDGQNSSILVRLQLVMAWS